MHENWGTRQGLPQNSIRAIRQTMLGQMVTATPCPRCRGEGRIVESTCETCHGEGRLERRRSLRVTIPPGIDEGHQVRLSNEGEAGPRGGPPGSLYVAVHVTPHPTLKREGTEFLSCYPRNPLIEACAGEGDGGVPDTEECRPGSHTVGGREVGGPASGRCMHLQRRLRRQAHACARSDGDGLPECVAAEDSGRRQGQNRVHNSNIRNKWKFKRSCRQY